MGTEQIQISGSISRNKKALLRTKLFRDNKRLTSAIIAYLQQFVWGNCTREIFLCFLYCSMVKLHWLLVFVWVESIEMLLTSAGCNISYNSAVVWLIPHAQYTLGHILCMKERILHSSSLNSKFLTLSDHKFVGLFFDLHWYSKKIHVKMRPVVIWNNFYFACSEK